jgi:2-polyprenyl-3-methyl-5-hydroxy-6-metoxy-1,4-benzoquinol methylase
MKFFHRFKSLLRNTFLNILFILPHRFTLRFLLSLDNWIYYLVGKVATHANNGIHPKHRYMKYHEFFINRILPNDNVLDIGCGNGVVDIEIAQRTGAKVTGIDSDAAKITEAKQRDKDSIVNFLVCDALQDLPNGSFKVIILSNVLEHILDRIQFLQTLKISLHPTRILIRVPLIDRDWLVALKQELDVDWRLDPTHYIEYTQETFSNEIQAAQMKIVYIEIRWGEIWSEVCPLSVD